MGNPAGTRTGGSGWEEAARCHVWLGTGSSRFCHTANLPPARGAHGTVAQPSSRKKAAAAGEGVRKANGGGKQMVAGKANGGLPRGVGDPHLLLHPPPHREGGRDRVKPAMKMREVGTRKKGGEVFNPGKGKKGYLCNYGLFCGVFLILFWFFPQYPNQQSEVYVNRQCKKC